MLQIYLFGQLRVFVDGVTYAFHGLPKTVPLWAYLLLQRKRPPQRERLAFTFWPDASEEIARTNLRRQLGDAHPHTQAARENLQEARKFVL